MPEKQFEMMIGEKEFFMEMAKVTVGKGGVGVLNVETNTVIEL